MRYDTEYPRLSRPGDNPPLRRAIWMKSAGSKRICGCHAAASDTCPGVHCRGQFGEQVRFGGIGYPSDTGYHQ